MMMIESRVEVIFYGEMHFSFFFARQIIIYFCEPRCLELILDKRDLLVGNFINKFFRFADYSNDIFG